MKKAQENILGAEKESEFSGGDLDGGKEEGLGEEDFPIKSPPPIVKVLMDITLTL